MNKKRLLMLLLLALLGVLVFCTLAAPAGAAEIERQSGFYATAYALVPPLMAIALALWTKEVYTSLFVGILMGALLYADFNLEKMVQTMFFEENGGMLGKLTDSWNVGILIFLVVLGIMVSLMNKAGGSAAFGAWTIRHIRSRMGVQLATMALGVLIFVDDYFNCLTVGSVMRPVTDTHKISRAKLAYIIDATAAPICIIAPISSWAAAVTSSVPEASGINGFQVFLKTIPYNFYAILSLVMLVFLIVSKTDFGPMKKHERNAFKGDLFTTGDTMDNRQETQPNPRGRVSDLVFPVVVLIITCIGCMIYTGGFFSGSNFMTAFAGADASKGLVMGSMISLVITFFYYMLRDVITFEEFAACIPEGFKAMVAPILILTLAWTLSGMTNLLGADVFVAGLVSGSASSFQLLLPAVIFAVASGLAFATGTSWGTFGILIPIIIGVFPNGEMMVITIAACLAGAVCGDHCSPISDTTIMASAGGQCSHVHHVATQLPYVITVAAVTFVSYIVAGIVQNAWIALAFSVLLLLSVLTIIKKKQRAEAVLPAENL